MEPPSRAQPDSISNLVRSTFGLLCAYLWEFGGYRKEINVKVYVKTTSLYYFARNSLLELIDCRFSLQTE